MEATVSLPPFKLDTNSTRKKKSMLIKLSKLQNKYPNIYPGIEHFLLSNNSKNQFANFKAQKDSCGIIVFFMG